MHLVQPHGQYRDIVGVTLVAVFLLPGSGGQVLAAVRLIVFAPMRDGLSSEWRS
jgi:hypothetical protein